MLKNDRRVITTWSGGIDSTAMIAQLLSRGYQVIAQTLNFYGTAFQARERKARELIKPHLLSLAQKSGSLFLHTEHKADWIWEFSPDGIEIPRRNRRIMDWLITKPCAALNCRNLAMGEYIGADSWVVKNHVPMADADARALTAYLYSEYGLDYRLFTLADFGECRFKDQRLKLGLDVLGLEVMVATTNCLEDGERDCGKCYKCVERAVAFDRLSLFDPTEYQSKPSESSQWNLYQRQMGRWEEEE